MTNYNHFIALKAYTKGSLISIFRNPSAVAFGFLFPIMFILVFGLMGNNVLNIELGVSPQSDKSNKIYSVLSQINSFHLITDESLEVMNTKIRKAELDGIITIEKKLTNGNEQFLIHIQTSGASRNEQSLKTIIAGLIAQSNLSEYEKNNLTYQVSFEKVESREYKMIDFILPGQLGFVLLSGGIMSTAFLLISLKQRLVIKRFFATPAKHSTIILGEGIARLVFSVIQVIFIIIFGVLVFDYTLTNGLVTVIEMILICCFGLIVFLGAGMIISTIAKNEQAVPPIANIFILPQLFLSGVFFSISVFPLWLQPICKILPLTFVNDSLRKIAFDGASLADISGELLGLTIWGIILYSIVIKVFKWEE